VLTVVGENRDGSSRLLLLGEDGHYYAYSLAEGATSSVELDEHWNVELPPDGDLFA